MEVCRRGREAGVRPAMISHPSPNFGPRPDSCAVDLLVLHYTGMPDAAGALARMCDPEAEVSAHYMIDEDGTVYQLVDEAMRAWHAGVSSWAGAENVNDRSIGIELVNPGHEFGYRAFTEPQMAALETLAGDIVARHGIPAARILGHSDVAPGRKTDPGELFDWERLAGAGIGIWPGAGASSATPATGDAMPLLTRFGYRVRGADALTHAVAAFQRHFRPGRVDGIADAETVARLDDLCRRFA